MTILTMPSYREFSQVRFSLLSNGLSFPSPLDGSVQTVEFPGARWMFSATLPPMRRDVAAAWQAFFTQLRGQSGRFYAGDSNATTPRGTALGSPLVNGGSQIGNSLITDAWTPSQSTALLPGDYFQVGNELKMVLSTVVSDGSGNATITFEPPLRAPPSDNAPIITSSPVCIMRLTDNDQSGWDIGGAGIYGMVFSAVEAFV